MVDVLTKKQRSFNMSRIRDKNTKPEIIVRSIIHRMGFRFRLHDKNLPGKPDLVFPRLKKVIQVHGCFWHLHNCRYGRVVPATNKKFWQTKRLSNKLRDRKNNAALRRLGWHLLIVWECWLKNPAQLKTRLQDFLTS